MATALRACRHQHAYMTAGPGDDVPFYYVVQVLVGCRRLQLSHGLKGSSVQKQHAAQLVEHQRYTWYCSRAVKFKSNDQALPGSNLLPARAGTPFDSWNVHGRLSKPHGCRLQVQVSYVAVMLCNKRQHYNPAQCCCFFTTHQITKASIHGHTAVGHSHAPCCADRVCSL